MVEKFWLWVVKARVTDDPAGDLIGDLCSDYLAGNRNFPRIHNLTELRNFLALRGACQGAQDAAPKVWRRFAQWRVK